MEDMGVPEPTSCDDECHETKTGNLDKWFAECKLKICHESRRVATKDEGGLMESLGQLKDMQPSLKSDAANQATSLMWGANLRQLAALLQSHVQSSTSAALYAVMCDVYWLEKLSRFGEAQNLRDERARLLASRTNKLILDSLLGAMQEELLEKRLQEADLPLAALQQRYGKISGYSLAANIVARAA